MTEPRTPSRTPAQPSAGSYPAPSQVPQAPRRRPSEERAAIAASSRTATQLAILALVIGVVALGLTAWRMLSPSGASSCQGTVWNALPAGSGLPQGWSMKGTTFDINRRTTQFAGQDTGSGSGAPNVLATVTCFPDGAADSVARAQAAARDVGQVVNVKSDLSDGGFEATDISGAIFLEFRRGDIVVDLAASSGATATDIETVASAYDKALGGPGGSIATPGPAGSGGAGASSAASGDPNAGLTHDAPDLEKLLPTKIHGVDMTLDSALGSTVLTSDPGGRAATAALKAKGKVPDDLRYAESIDQTQTVLVSVLAVDVKGLSAADTESLLLDWFQLSGVGVTRTDVTLGGKTWTKFDLGDEGAMNYIRTEGTAVLVITTDDPSLAAEAAAAVH